MTTKRSGSPFDLCNFVFADGRGCCMPSISSLGELLLARRFWGVLKSCRGPSLRSLTRPTGARKKKSGCSARDDRQGKFAAASGGRRKESERGWWLDAPGLLLRCHPERNGRLFPRSRRANVGHAERERGKISNSTRVYVQAGELKCG